MSIKKQHTNYIKKIKKVFSPSFNSLINGKIENKTLLLCCPEFSPQMTGDPLEPDTEMANESVVQWPMEPPEYN
jgi:hypothetical protein